MKDKPIGVRLRWAAALLTAFHVLPSYGQQAVDLHSAAIQNTHGDILLEPSRAYIFVGKSGFGHEHAVAGKFRSGNVRLGADQDAGQLVFEMASFEADPDYARKFIGLEGTSDLETQRKVTANMLGSDVLDVTQFPTAEFRIASARLLGSQSKRKLPVYELMGDFTLHGVTKPLRVLTEVEQMQDRVRLMGSFVMLQSNFGMKPFSKGFGMVGVSDELRIYGDIYISNRESKPPQK